MQSEQADIVIVGAGAAGLMAAVWAGRSLAGTGSRIVMLDGAKKVGIKILVAGGGRCNVTHHAVDEKQYAGGSRNTIRKVLKRFDVPETIGFFRDLGVELKREDTGKLFPVTDSAQTVLNALLGEVRRVGVELRHPWRVGSVERLTDGRFCISRSDGESEIISDQVVLATGGMALPRSGSDGGGYDLARSLGHSITERLFPSLVPLIVGNQGKWLTELSGISSRVRINVCSGKGQRLASYENDMLCTHFGLSGPAVMDASRWLTDARGKDPDATIRIAWLPGETFETVDRALVALGSTSVLVWIKESLPERLARAICESQNVDATTPGSQLTKVARRALAHALVEMPVEVTGDRGFSHAEATAGGVPLAEIDPRTMSSRVCDGLTLIGEILDVDGRIGGFNFQWAWASGMVAGTSLAQTAGQSEPV